MSQMRQYKYKIVKTDQWEEFDAEGCASPIVAFAGEDSKDIIVQEGQFIKLSDGNTDIEFIQKNQ